MAGEIKQVGCEGPIEGIRKYIQNKPREHFNQYALLKIINGAKQVPMDEYVRSSSSYLV